MPMTSLPPTNQDFSISGGLMRSQRTTLLLLVRCVPPLLLVIIMSSTLSGKFLYVLIPADETVPIEQREGDKSGGLSDDALIKTAKDYFFQQTGGDSRLEALNNASPEERKVMAQQIRNQVTAGNPNAQSHLSRMNDDAMIDLLRYVVCCVCSWLVDSVSGGHS